MIMVEVNFMDEQYTPETFEEEKYEPRPRWQVWCARIGLILFLIFVVYQILTIAKGGLL